MKKLLGILALALSVSGIASADQDVVKNVYLNQDFRQSYTDKSGTDANELGNEGFKKANKERYRVRTEVGTTLGLNDEWGLDANLYYKHDEDRFYDKGNRTGDEASTDLIDANLSKNIQWGSLDTNTKLGVRHWTKKAGVGHKETTGESNEIYFGPTFGMNVFGQNIKTTLEAVYFTQNGTGNQDDRYYRTASHNNANHGWGANLILGTDGKLLEGGFGSIGYYATLEHYLRDANGENNKSNVKLDYTVGLTYDTPSWHGLYAFINPENEWTKHTAIDGYENEFNVWTGFGYKTSFDTSIGTVTINPSVRYNPVNKVTDKGEYYYKKDEKKTTETNELRVGVKVGLAVKN